MSVATQLNLRYFKEDPLYHRHNSDFLELSDTFSNSESESTFDESSSSGDDQFLDTSWEDASWEDAVQFLIDDCEFVC
jgi:hypothetical protein